MSASLSLRGPTRDPTEYVAGYLRMVRFCALPGIVLRAPTVQQCFAVFGYRVCISYMLLLPTDVIHSHMANATECDAM